MTKLDDIKTLLGLTGDNTQDARIELLITMTTSQIESITGYKMTQEELEDQLFDGDATRVLLLPWMPVKEVASIEFNDGNTWTTLAETEYELRPRVGEIVFVSPLPRGINNIRISYTAGDDTLNGSLDAALNEFIMMKYTLRPGVKSESVDGASVSYADPESIKNHPIFSQYIRI
jgi:hypothetical protein